MVARTRPTASLSSSSAAMARTMTRIVPNGERVAVVAVLMVATRGILHAGDQTLIQNYDKVQ